MGTGTYVPKVDMHIVQYPKNEAYVYAGTVGGTFQYILPFTGEGKLSIYRIFSFALLPTEKISSISLYVSDIS